MLKHVVIAVLCLLAAAQAAGQTTTATVLGTVIDEQKAVLPGVTVTARNTDTGVETTSVSDPGGRYRLSNLRPGTYDLRAELSGFAVRTRSGLQLFVGQEIALDIELTVAPVAESVTVSAGAPLVETTKSEVSLVVDRAQIDALPLAGRNFSDLTRLTPDVQSGDRMGGMQSNLSNTYLVDGVTNDRAWTGGSRAGYSAENIREFRVITQQYAAEYGQASGGVVNVVTRSGSNRYEQRGFLFYRADALDARNAFATGKAPFDREQFGAFAGGPIQRDRMFYFASYEGINQDESAVVSTPVQTGEYPRTTDQHQLFGKLDYQITSNHALVARWNEDRSDIKNSGVGGRSTVEYGSTSFYRNHDLYSSLNSILGPTRLNELRVQYSWRPGGSIPNTPTGPEELFASSNRGKAYSDPQDTTETRFQIVDNLSWRYTGWGGEHDFKAGVDFSRATLDGFFCNYCDGSFTFPKDVYNAADPTTYPTTYTQRLGSSEFVIPNNIFAVFIQDSWKPRPNVTINAGVRYDYESYADQLTDTNNISPRLAVSWDPWNAGKTVFRGGGGLFQDQITLNQWLIIVLNVINAQEFIVLSNPGYPDPFGGTPRPPSPANVELFDPGLDTPYAAHVTGGMKHEVLNGLAVSADYVFVRGWKQIRRRDLNAPVDGSRTRPDPTKGRVLIHESTGNRDHHAVLLSADRRFGRRWRFQASYTWSNTKSDSEARNSTVLPTDQYDLRADWGPADADARHNFVLTGQVALPWGFQFAGILQMRSAYPFNPVSGRDTNNDSRTGDRPDVDPAGTYPTNGVTEYGRFSIPVNRPGNLTRNAFRGPDFKTLDLRLSKAFTFGGRRLELLAEAFNAANWVNYGSYTTSIQSALFGKPQSALDPRQVQLGIRFDF